MTLNFLSTVYPVFGHLSDRVLKREWNTLLYFSYSQSSTERWGPFFLLVLCGRSPYGPVCVGSPRGRQFFLPRHVRPSTLLEVPVPKPKVVVEKVIQPSVFRKTFDPDSRYSSYNDNRTSQQILMSTVQFQYHSL